MSSQSLLLEINISIKISVIVWWRCLDSHMRFLCCFEKFHSANFYQIILMLPIMLQWPQLESPKAKNLWSWPLSLFWRVTTPASCRVPAPRWLSLPSPPSPFPLPHNSTSSKFKLEFVLHPWAMNSEKSLDPSSNSSTKNPSHSRLILRPISVISLRKFEIYCEKDVFLAYFCILHGPAHFWLSIFTGRYSRQFQVSVTCKEPKVGAKRCLFLKKFTTFSHKFANWSSWAHMIRVRRKPEK